MRFGYTILYVADVARALDFYGRAFGLTTKFVDPSGNFGELDTGATALAFCSRSLLVDLGKTPGAPDAEHPCAEIAFVTDDVAGAVETAVAAGARLMQAPTRTDWGQTTAYVADPDGFAIEFCTPMGS